jgi:hypothetical protein
MDPKVILERLVDRLNPLVGPILKSNWEVNEHLAADGTLHLCQALADALAALGSSEREQITTAAAICPTLERTGQDLRIKHQAKIASAKAKDQARHQARLGGKGRGAAQAAAARAAWDPYVRDFQNRVGRGVAPSVARATITKNMERDNFRPPGVRGFPDARTIRKWFPAKPK